MTTFAPSLIKNLITTFNEMSKFQVSLSQLPGFDFVGSSVFMDISVFIAWSATAGSGIGVVGVLGTCCNQRFFYF